MYRNRCFLVPRIKETSHNWALYKALFSLNNQIYLIYLLFKPKHANDAAGRGQHHSNHVNSKHEHWHVPPLTPQSLKGSILLKSYLDPVQAITNRENHALLNSWPNIPCGHQFCWYVVPTCLWESLFQSFLCGWFFASDYSPGRSWFSGTHILAGVDP